MKIKGINWSIEEITTGRSDNTRIDGDLVLEATLIGKRDPLSAHYSMVEIANGLQSVLSGMPGRHVNPELAKEYIRADIESVSQLDRALEMLHTAVAKNYPCVPKPVKVNMPGIKNVIFNNPATIVIWEDGEKTVVKAQNEEIFDPEKGFVMAISKRALGNKGNYCEVFKKWVPAGDVPKLHTHELYESVGGAYQQLLKILEVSGKKATTKAMLVEAIEDAVGLLGAALEDN